MNISGIMRTIGFSESDIECILKADEACAVKVREIVNELYEGKIEYKASVDKVSETCTCGVHEYTVHMLYALCCAEVLYKKYAEKICPMNFLLIQ